MDILTGYDLGIFLTVRACMFAVFCWFVWYVVTTPMK